MILYCVCVTVRDWDGSSQVSFNILTAVTPDQVFFHLAGAVLRQHVLWFDELYQGHEDYQWDRTQAAARAMDLLLFVGTSFSVGVTELFVHHGLLGRVPIFSIDPGGARPPYPGIRVIQQRAEDLLPAVCDRLGA